MIGIRRVKCDGQPRCAACALHGEVCSYNGHIDRRKPPTKQYVEALEHRVRQLEKRNPSARDGHGLSSIESSPESSLGVKSPETMNEGGLTQKGAPLRGAGAVKTVNQRLPAPRSPSS